ncbi:hypothetical protein G5V57_22380 [Nordella sp. HKS 07]|uniref:sugar-transfer associated ATP-grasp domain-containing protein n=1 Tax=Nordella sp. HKS 07 TaxID=2712222 RepID=UPI0013E0EF8F|nr:sugar-transfer associated ATP-grasp domain-containing protein [Nordella sp. HKS 07]QIG50228.1 hypothetical protein G5V57_22380 [Nordella sp. HKS 07]
MVARSLPTNQTHRSKRGTVLSVMEAQALTALHAFPLLYCRSGCAPAGSTSALLHDIYREEILARLKDMSFFKRKLVVFVWPPAMVLWGLGLTLANGAYVARRFGRGMIGQFADQMRLAFTQGIPVNFFYTYELHDRQNWSRAQEYVLRGHIKGGCQLYKRLYRDDPVRRESARILNDKLSFHQFCAARDLPTAHLFAVISNGAFAWTDPGQTTLPKIDLFLKPRKENGGSGAERWAHADGRYHRHGHSSVLDAKQLTERLAKLSQKQAYLVYECLANHPEIGDLSAGALCTFRLHTMLNEAGKVEHLFTMFRMSQFRRRVVETQDGIAAAVDPVTGVLGPASNSSPIARWLDHHPVTGARITDRKVPFWPEALALALSTHAQLGSPINVGWDIAVTARGPIILEANKSPDVEIEQRLNGPWGNGRFGKLLAHHLMREITQTNHPRMSASAEMQAAAL